MRIAKLIAGVLSLVLAMTLPGCLALGIGTNFGFGRVSADMLWRDLFLAFPFALFAIGLLAAGSFLILKRHTTFSRRAIVLISFAGLVGVIPALGMIGSLRSRSVDPAEDRRRWLRDIDAANEKLGIFRDTNGTYIYVGATNANSSSPGEALLPVLKVDDQHSVGHSLLVGTNALRYRICATPKVIIDATHYAFDVPAELQGKPITDLSLFGGTTNLCAYQLVWEPGKTRYELSRATLQPSNDSPAFGGFDAGQTWTVMIGAAHATNKSLTVWWGTIEVQ